MTRVGGVGRFARARAGNALKAAPDHRIGRAARFSRATEAELVDALVDAGHIADRSEASLDSSCNGRADGSYELSARRTEWLERGRDSSSSAAFTCARTTGPACESSFASSLAASAPPRSRLRR